MNKIFNKVLTLANSLRGKNGADFQNALNRANLTTNDKRLIGQIVQNFVSRSKQDIGSWRTALTVAENIANPNRVRLYALYKDVKLDDQVLSCIGNLKASLKAEGFYVGNASDKEKVDEATDLIMRPWFYDFIDSCVDSITEGFVLLERSDMVKGAKGIEIGGFDEIPKEHVVPERDMVVVKVGDDKGINFTDPAFARTVFPIGKKTNLGSLNPAAPKAIIKKNAEAAWAEFCEIFGMPIRVGKVSSRNPADITRMESFLKAMGSAAYAVTGIDDTIELKETSKGDAWQVYDKLMERQDKAISKIFLGQTMTTDNGSSRSQAEVHERVADKRMFELKLFIDFTVNFRLFPFLIANGYKLDGMKFYWEAATMITDTDISMDEFLVNNFEFENLDYFKKKYRVPITAVRAEPGTKKTELPSDKGKDKPKDKLSQVELLNKTIEELYQHAH